MIKNIFAAFILLISVFSCKKEEAKTIEKKTVNDTVSKAEPTEDLLKPIDTACSSKNKTEDYITALQWYKSKTEKEIAQNSPEQNDKLYEVYIKIRDKYTACLSGTLGNVLDEYVNYYDAESKGYKFPENIKKLNAKLNKGGLEFMEIGEGYTEIWSLPDHYFSVFKDKVTPDYNDYIQQLSKESEGLYSADAGLVISWKELGDRTIFWENFMKKYPKSPLISRVKEMYNSYLYDYLFGMDNTPTHEHSDGTLYDENRQEFNRIIKKYPNSNAAKKAKELMNLFDAHLSDEEIHKKIDIERQY
jgi:hypothetical protein